MTNPIERADPSRRRQLRATFDDAPEVYDRTRPVCPPQLFDDLVALARLPEGARLLEIGTGTGQATLPLAQRGFTIVGVELGANLARFARAKLAAFPNVQIVNSSFEAWDPAGQRFDGVVVVHAFHWLDPERRFAKSAEILKDDGALAVVGSSYVVPDGADPFWTEVQEDYDAVDPVAFKNPLLRPEAVGDLGGEIEASGYFRNVAVRRYLWDVTFTADDYLALLGTSSGHRVLDDDKRRSLFERIRRRLEARDEPTIRAPLLSTLNVARRV